jgi:integrase
LKAIVNLLLQSVATLPYIKFNGLAAGSRAHRRRRRLPLSDDGRIGPKRRIATLGTRDKSEAFKELKDLDFRMAVKYGIAKEKQHATLTSTSLTLKEGVADYLQFVARPRSLKGGSRNTLKRYAAVFNKAVPFFEKLGIRTWNEVSERTLQAYGTHLLKQSYAFATQGLEIVTIKQALNHWIKLRLLPESQQFDLEIDKVVESTAYCFTSQEVEAMIEHCRKNEHLRWLADVIVGLGYTGMRIGELSQLRRSAIDLDRGVIRIVDDSRSAIDPKSGVRTTKSGRCRTVPIHASLRPVLDRLCLANAGDVVFRALRGGQLRPRNVLTTFIDEVIEPLKGRFPAREGEKSFYDGRLHSLRHHFCSLCASNGVNEQTLMAWLGHTNSTVTRRYFHLDDATAQFQMSKLPRSSA